ncbi:MAG: glutaredoxin family protein [Verrucomicrobiae bacterium]|nr:glutaredoxin family protein [Verrucomicrobiae bacterium]
MSQFPMKLFIRSWCGWCQEAMQWLDSHGFRYEKVDIGLHPNARDEMIQISHQPRVPTLVVEEKVLADFDIKQLETFLKQLKLWKGS